MGTSYSHLFQLGHSAPLLRQGPRDAVVIEVPEAIDADNREANYEPH